MHLAAEWSHPSVLTGLNVAKLLCGNWCIIMTTAIDLAISTTYWKSTVLCMYCYFRDEEAVSLLSVGEAQGRRRSLEKLLTFSLLPFFWGGGRGEVAESPLV